VKESFSPLEPVNPVRPPAGYIGGKRNLSKRLVAKIAATPHGCYAEPFVGMGGVFFRRTSRPSAEAINDWSSDVANLFRILQRHYLAFVDECRWKLTSRHEFERLMREDPTTLTDLERATRFLYLQRTAFGGKVAGRNFGTDTTGGAKFDIVKLEPMLADVRDRLASVRVERLPYADFIARYDRPHTLFFCDPPYIGCEGDYGQGMFSAEDHALLRKTLGAISGRFILTINDHPLARELWAGCAIEEVGLNYRISGKATAARELIITGGQ
jgi:DNA adenine methylase